MNTKTISQLYTIRPVLCSLFQKYSEIKNVYIECRYKINNTLIAIKKSQQILNFPLGLAMHYF